MAALRGNVKMAMASMRNAKWRSFLTMLGIIIGVVSVVTVVSIGEGVKNQVNGQIDQLGRDLITVRPGEVFNGGSTGVGDITAQSFTNALQPNPAGVLTDKDVATVAQTSGVDKAVPLGVIQGELSVGERKLSSPLVLGTTPQLNDILHKPVESGSFFDEVSLRDEPEAAIIGKNIAHQLFRQRAPIGRSFDFLGQSFIVQGVLKEFDTTPLSMAADFNDTIFIPYNTAKELTGSNAPLFQILVKPKDATKVDQTVADVSKSLSQAHQGQQQFSVLRQDQSLTVTNNIVSLLTKLITGIAAISLLVGGIGIMNVMLVSVAERMHEIGIRKALGASNRQIALQFMTEAALLSTFGALIGIVLAAIINYVLFVTTSLTPVITWQAALAAVGVSLAVGIIFGTAPAIKAARKDPIDALRNISG